MVQRVYRQILSVDSEAEVTIATSKSQVSAIHNQLGENVGISVEPCRRDTFPAIALAAAYLHESKHAAVPECALLNILSGHLFGGLLLKYGNTADRMSDYVRGQRGRGDDRHL